MSAASTGFLPPAAANRAAEGLEGRARENLMAGNAAWLLGL